MLFKSWWYFQYFSSESLAVIIFKVCAKEQMLPLNGQHYPSCVDCLQVAHIHTELWNHPSNRSTPSAEKSGKQPVAQMALLRRHKTVHVWNTGVSCPEFASQPTCCPARSHISTFYLNQMSHSHYQKFRRVSPLSPVLIILLSDQSQS